MSDLNYKNAGVDVDANSRWTQWIAQTVKNDRQQHEITHVGAIGGFAGAMNFSPAIKEIIIDAMVKRFYRKHHQFPTTSCELKNVLFNLLDSFSLVACTDGVGTKTMIGERFGKLETFGYDLLAMSVNDMVAGGAIPIAFLDYIGCHHIEKDGEFCYQPFVEGLVKACREIDVELLGGETAEMSDNYTKFGSDLTGFALGILVEDDIPQKETIRSGDFLLGLKSSGIHSNGYSTVRKVMEARGYNYEDKPAELNGKTILETVLTPTRLYVKQALAANATQKVKGMAHITGGGLVENIERALPTGLKAIINEDKIGNLDVFRWLSNQGLNREDMLKTFNMGIGYVFVVSPHDFPTVRCAIGEELINVGFVDC